MTGLRKLKVIAVVGLLTVGVPLFSESRSRPASASDTAGEALSGLTVRGLASDNGLDERPSAAPFLIDRARQAGLSRFHMTWAATEVDYNRDGRMDVWIGKHYRGGDLWRNNRRGGYVRVKTAAWPRHSLENTSKTVDRHDCAWADVDRNGRPDSYCSAGRFNTNGVKIGRDNELWLQGRKGGFRDVGTEWGVGDVCGRGRNVTFIDANGDRFPDLFVGNDVPRNVPDPCNRHPRRYPNEHSKLFVNKHGNGFRYAKFRFDFGPGVGSRCAVRVDYDRDGWTDLLACGSDGRASLKRSGSGGPEELRLFRNRQGHRFADVSGRLPAVLAMDATVGDLDGDHDPDLILASWKGFSYALNTDGRFGDPVLIEVPPIGRARAVAVGDADLDGDLDVFGVVVRRFQPNPNDRLYLNDGLAFTPVVAPRAGGTADEVTTLHPGKQGRAEFLVMNGYHFERPHPNIQLIRLVQ